MYGRVAYKGLTDLAGLAARVEYKGRGSWARRGIKGRVGLLPFWMVEVGKVSQELSSSGFLFI